MRAFDANLVRGLGQNYLWEKYPGEIAPLGAKVVDGMQAFAPAHTATVGLTGCAPCEAQAPQGVGAATLRTSPVQQSSTAVAHPIATGGYTPYGWNGYAFVTAAGANPKPNVSPTGAAGEWVSAFDAQSQVQGQWIWYPLPEGTPQHINGTWVVFSRSNPGKNAPNGQGWSLAYISYWIADLVPAGIVGTASTVGTGAVPEGLGIGPVLSSHVAIPTFTPPTPAPTLPPVGPPVETQPGSNSGGSTPLPTGSIPNLPVATTAPAASSTNTLLLVGGIAAVALGLGGILWLAHSQST
jgi:hypothetical protein